MHTQKHVYDDMHILPTPPHTYTHTNSLTHPHKHRVAQEGASFGEAFWLCSQSLTSMQAVADLTVAQQLTATIKQQYQELLLHLEGSLSAVCIDFDAQAYTKVLEGYVCVDAVTQLGEDVKGAFAGAAGNAVVKVGGCVWGVGVCIHVY